MFDNKESLMKAAGRTIAQGYAARLPMMMVKAVTEEFGEKGWKVLRRVAEQFGRERADILKRALEVDVNDARSLGKIFDFEDDLNGVKGEWIESSPEKATKCETKCSASQVFKDFPPYCEKMLYWLSEATIRELNPNAKLRDFSKVRCKVHGDDVCEVGIEINNK